MNKLSVYVLGLGIVALSLTGCCCPKSSTVYEPVAVVPAAITETPTSYVQYGAACGNSFPAFDWLDGYQYAYEILDKRAEGGGYKVKILEQQNGMMAHLECVRNLRTPADAYNWLRQSGYSWNVQEELEYNPNISRHKFVSRGVLFRVPPRLQH